VHGDNSDAKFTVKVASMFPRSLQLPKSSFFLFGPRGTGKSAWLRTSLKAALTVKPRETVRGYFDVLTDTLIAQRLPAYRPRAKVKEAALPKLYWFDPGVLHATAGGFDQPMPSDWNGILLEHLVLHELQCHLHYSGVKGSLGYWATPHGTEVDFVWWRGRRKVAIEVKHARDFRRDHTKGFQSLLGEGSLEVISSTSATVNCRWTAFVCFPRMLSSASCTRGKSSDDPDP
jgi:hypothetical protein